RILTANLDGSGLAVLSTAIFNPNGIALDPSVATLYVADHTDGTIEVLGTDGSGPTTIYSAGVQPIGVGLALDNGPSSPRFHRGDANDDDLVDISDVVFALAALFIPGSLAVGCEDAADVNDDGVFDIADASYLLLSLFVPGSFPPPPPTHPDCGFDPTPDGLDCVTSTCP
ncbi:MAG: hypothetical protein KDC38_15560, partial [Planctomycetes bacterium]|nr:hypothetical protein [Planctomycetota bacterium]